VKLFDRTRRRPVLTPQGQVLLTHARTVAGDVDRLKAHAKHLAGRARVRTLATIPVRFTAEPVLKVPLIHVASPRHPLASYDRPIPSGELAKHIQLVLTDSTLTKGQELGVLSPRTWRLADLGSKHAFLRAGLGWGGMPEELVRSDRAAHS
jgi:DNA-binding transcriptional LysR family regulator